jgi:hypothetical protein
MSGDICGIYAFESNNVLEAFHESGLVRSITSPYAGAGFRREALDELWRGSSKSQSRAIPAKCRHTLGPLGRVHVW